MERWNAELGGSRHCYGGFESFAYSHMKGVHMFDMTPPQRAVSSPSIEPGPLSKPQSHDCWNCKLSMSEHRQISETTSMLVQPTALWKTVQKHRKQSQPLLNVEKDMKCHSYSDDTQNNWTFQGQEIKFPVDTQNYIQNTSRVLMQWV